MENDRSPLRAPRPRATRVIPAYPQALGLMALALCSCDQVSDYYDKARSLFLPTYGGTPVPYVGLPSPTATPPEQETDGPELINQPPDAGPSGEAGVKSRNLPATKR